MRDKIPIDLATIQSIFIQSIKVEWIFGQSFDDHQDQFVTLSNRNFTKIILDKLDQEAAKKLYQDNRGQNSKSSGVIVNPDKRSEKDEEEQIDSSFVPLQKADSSPWQRNESSQLNLLNQKKSNQHQRIIIEWKGMLAQ